MTVAKMIPLSDLKVGERGMICQLRGGQEYTGRLAALGFTPGVAITVTQNEGHGLILVIVRGVRMALGRGEAGKILVESLTKSADSTKLQRPLTATKTEVKPIVVALAGQPNSGKSTVFNLLTGLSQHVGNWPGKTIEQKIGFHHTEQLTLKLVDLPGTYSLTANSLEERVARDFILHEQPDLVVFVANAACLERHLYLLSELLTLPAPVILGLNMMDVAEQQGQQIDVRALEAALALPVVPMVASRNQGVRELVQTIDQVILRPSLIAPNRPEIRPDHKVVLDQVNQLLADHVPAPYPPDWVALKLLQGDLEITNMMQARLNKAAWQPVHDILMAHEDAVLAIASGRYAWIERIVRTAVTQTRMGQITLTERLDRWATHSVWGILALLCILGVAFGLTFSVGVPLQRALDTYLVQASAVWLRAAQGAKIVKGPMKDAVASELLLHATEELAHADMLSLRIIQLGGTPLLSPEEWIKRTHCGYDAPTDPFVKQILAQNIAGEQCAIDVYQKLQQLVKDKDPVTYNIVLTILQQEVEHEEDLQSLDEDLESLMMRHM